jgi:hypothetical protein
MISADLVFLIRQLLQPLQRNVWYAINITNSYNPTLNVAMQLNEQDYTALMLATGIMNQRGINIVISLDYLEFLKSALQENMTIHISWASIQNRNHYFFAIDRPTNPSPKRQVKADPRIIIN